MKQCKGKNCRHKGVLLKDRYFSTNNANKDGLNDYCRDCVSENAKLNRQKAKDEASYTCWKDPECAKGVLDV